MKKLRKYIRPYIKESILGPLFKLLEAALELIVPLVVASIIDRGIGQGDRPYVVWMCLLMALLGLIGLLFSVTAQYFAAKAATGFAASLRQTLFRRIMGLSYHAQDDIHSSTLITRMTSDMNQVESGLNMALRLLLRSPFVVFGAMIMAFTLDVPAALVFAVVIPLLCAAVFGIMLPCIPLYKKVQGKLDKVLGHTRENLTGVRVIRAFCKEEDETAAFDQDNQQLTGAQLFVGRISALLNPLTYVLINVALLVLLWTGAIRVDHGLLTQGTVIALYNYMSQILVELIKLANLIISITKSLACAKRIEGMLDLPVEQQADAVPSPVAGAPRISFRDVSLRYHPDSEPALRHITLEVQPGETLGIIGGTSSGKTSLINLIPRFYEASEGQVLVDGVDVRDYPAAALRSRIGVVPQKAELFRGSIRDNLLWGNPLADDQALWEALDWAQAKSMTEEKSGQLDHKIEQGGRNLSGGQRQRLTVARALVRRPSLLLLDDSTAALDYATEASLRQALRTLPWNPTVLLVSQRVAAMQGADRIAVLDDGELVGLDTHENLLHDCTVYQEICRSQKREEASSHG